jgi:hypothetical protein
MKFGSQLNFHMENILTSRIDHLNFENGEMVRNTRIIHATHSTVA